MNLPADQAKELLRHVQKQIGDLKPKVRSLQQELEALVDLEQALRPFAGEQAAEAEHATRAGLGFDTEQAVPGYETNGEFPGTTEAVTTVLKEAAPKPMAPRDVLAELERRGWMSPNWGDPSRVVGTVLLRLIKRRRSPVIRVRTGLYKYQEEVKE